MYKNEDWLNFSASLKSELFFEQKEFPNFNYEVLDQFTGERFEIDISSPSSRVSSYTIFIVN